MHLEFWTHKYHLLWRSQKVSHKTVTVLSLFSNNILAFRKHKGVLYVSTQGSFAITKSGARVKRAVLAL